MCANQQDILTEEGKLKRFFSKLLGEAAYIQADEIVFCPSAGGLAISLNKDRIELKTNLVKLTWAKLIVAYLKEHCCKSVNNQNFSAKLESQMQVLSVDVVVGEGYDGNPLVRIYNLQSIFSGPARRENVSDSAGKIELADDFFLKQKKEEKDAPRILLVEDDEDQRGIIELVLKDQRYDVRMAADGEQALKLLKDFQPDLIISDLMMPVMDGYSFVKALKEETLLKDIPVLILTVLGDEDREYKLLALGVDDYCEKTVQRKILLQRIENLLKRARR